MDEIELADGEAQLIDVRHLGREQVIGAWRVGDVLIDPGPSSSVATLLAALGDRPPRAIALTHIHLDHAGAAGTLARRFPDAEVWVHERGAPHLIDPRRLLDSAGRLYGEQMQRLFATQLYNGNSPKFDAEGRVHVDDWEMRPEVQAAVAEIWPQVTTENLAQLTDIQGYRSEFLKLFGFGLPGIDYQADVDPHLPMP